MTGTDIKLLITRKRWRGSKDTSKAAKANIGVILDSEDKDLKKYFLNLKQEFNLKEEEFNIMICRTKGVKNGIFDASVFTIQNLRWNGKMDHSGVTSFLETNFDLLISFTEAENKLASFLVSEANANVKVGREQNRDKSLDFVISTKYNESEIFLQELKRYKSKIKSAV